MGTKPQAGCRGNAAFTRGVLSVIALTIVLTGVFDAGTNLSQLNTYPGYVLAERSLVEPSRWMGEHLPAGVTVATRRIGALAYYSHLNVFDYAYGLTDPKVARMVGRRGRRFDLPGDPELAAAGRSRALINFSEDAATLDYVLSQSGGTREKFLIHGGQSRYPRVLHRPKRQLAPRRKMGQAVHRRGL